MTRKKTSFWKLYWTRHFPILLLITVAVVGLEVIGLLTGPELWILDHALLPGRTPSPEIHLVEISEGDYATWFGSTSPLKPELVLGLIDAIVARKPRVIGVDIDTRDWGPLESIPCSLANRQQILFPDVPENKGDAERAHESATVKDPKTDRHDAVTSGLHCFIPAEGPTIIWAEIPTNDQEPLELGRVLGQDPEKVIRSMGLSPDETQTVIGIPRFPVDPDGVVREYRGDFEIKGLSGRMNSLARAVVEQYSPALAVTKKEVLFNFAGKAGAENYAPTDAGLFLRGECIENKSFAERFKNECKDPGHPELPYLINKIVLVSGAYGEARDTHRTPIGEIAGVEMLAQAIDSDLHGGGIRLLPWPVSALLDLLASTLVVYLYFRLKSWPFYGFLLGWGIVIVAVAMCFVLLRFKLAWLNVVPVVVGANLEQLWHHGAELRHAQRKK
jgi:CHASE2 domain-containing sensor protein